MIQPNDSSNLDVVLENVSKQGSFAVNNSVILPENKKKTEFRFKKQFRNGTFGYVITVVNSGIESGMVVDFRRMKLKEAEKDMPFVNDDQCVKSFMNSSSIDWKVVENRTGKLVVPSRIVQKAIEGRYWVEERVWTFKWNSIDAPDISKMSLGACKEICEEFSSDIGLVLGRGK